MGRVVLAALIALLVGAPSAGAATYTVNRTDDPTPGSECGFGDPCSFREAVLAANDREGRDVIVVHPGSYELEPDPSAGLLDDLYGDLDIKGTVNIFGSGRRSTRISVCASDRAMEVHHGAVEVRDMRITGCGSQGDGGGIATPVEGQGSLRLIDMRLDHNNAVATGGNLFAGASYPVTVVRSMIDTGTAGGAGGGIAALGRLTVTDSTVDSNTSSDRGGNVAAGGPFLEIRNSTISAGTARAGGGNLFIDGVTGNRSIENSTLDAGSVGGGASGGAIQVLEVGLRIADSTIAQNRTLTRGGGVSALLGARVSLSDSTVAGNRARTGAGLYGGQGGIITVRDSLLARNLSPRGEPVDCLENVRSHGHNIFQRRCAFNRNTDVRTSRPGLGTFALHGATTRTFAIHPTSPAVDAGSRRCSPRDQRNRGSRRHCDIGAFEYQGPAPRRRRG